MSLVITFKLSIFDGKETIIQVTIQRVVTNNCFFLRFEKNWNMILLVPLSAGYFFVPLRPAWDTINYVNSQRTRRLTACFSPLQRSC